MNVRETITTLVVSALETISTSTGYNTDFDSVSEWKVTPFDDDKCEISVHDTSDEIESDDERILHTHSINFEVVISLSDGASTISSVRHAIEDVYAVLNSSTGIVSNAKLKVWPKGDDIEVDQNRKKVAVATIRFAVECKTKAWQQTILYS